jgi:hypothetical protein
VNSEYCFFLEALERKGRLRFSASGERELVLVQAGTALYVVRSDIETTVCIGPIRFRAFAESRWFTDDSFIQ